MAKSHALPGTLPCVVQVGFAGSRRLFDDPPVDPDTERQWHEAVVCHIAESMEELPQRLQLSPQHFLCGISSIARGADAIFTQACRERQIPQRLFLPQPIADFLVAAGDDGTPDFSPAERTEAESLAASQHIIQQRVVSHSPERTDRFRETNAEILRVSDVVVCLLQHNSNGKPGGTDELLGRALAIKTPLLEIRLTIEHGQPVCRNEWHIPSDYSPNQLDIPAPLNLEWSAEKIPSSQKYGEPLKNLASTQAKHKQKVFRLTAGLIIIAHVAATCFAALALGLHSLPQQFHLLNGPLLGLEFIALAYGLWKHIALHHFEAARIWANARMMAEITRSLRALYPRPRHSE